jgi:hypothetical protein
MKTGYFDPDERRREKQISRDQDDSDLREGRISSEALQRQNSIFASLDLSSSSVRRSARMTDDEKDKESRNLGLIVFAAGLVLWPVFAFIAFKNTKKK